METQPTYPVQTATPYNSSAPESLSPESLDLEHPWLGLESFRETARAYFFGREAEVHELHLRIRAHKLLVLYGRSGLGKTSILTAGLIPRLREEGKHPLLLRLRYDDPNLDPISELVAAVFGCSETSISWVQHLGTKLGFILPEDAPSRLWLRLHFRGESPEVSHLILDQFEEVFTLGRQRSGTEEALRDAMAILLQCAIPEPINSLIAEHDTFLDSFDPDCVPVRIVLSLRDDYVYALNRWWRHLSGLGGNNFELRALRGPAAFDAVFRPGTLRCKYQFEAGNLIPSATGLSPIIDEGTAGRVVRFVARKDTDAPLEEIEAVPPILSLLCHELNEIRLASHTSTDSQILFRERDADVESIINAFYERCLAGRPEAVRVFIEDELVSYSGARLVQDEDSILRVFEDGFEISHASDSRQVIGFGNAESARACLDDLVTMRLLSPVVGDRPAYELTHDLLATVVQNSRSERAHRLELEEAKRRAEMQLMAKDVAERQARRARRLVSMTTIALVFVFMAAVTGWVQFRDAEKARRMAIVAEQEAIKATKTAEQERERAVAARKDADALSNFLQYNLRDSLEKLGRSDLLIAIDSQVRKYHQDNGTADDAKSLGESAAALLQEAEKQSAQGALTDALKSYRDALAILERLVKQDPNNSDWQGQLAFGYWRTGKTLARGTPNSKDEGRAKLQQGRDLLRSMQEHFGLNSQQQKWLDEIEKDLRAMTGNVMSTKETRQNPK